MTKYKMITKTLSIILVILVAFAAAPSGYCAVSSDGELELNTDFAGYLTENDKTQTYKITVTDPGILYWGCYAYMYGTDLYLLDDQGKELHNVYMYRNEDAEYSYKKIELALEKGTYYLQIKSLFAGKYRFKNSFMEIGSTEKEKNDNPKTANKVTLGKKIVGLLGVGDDNDTYLVSIASKGEVRVRFKAFMQNADLEIYNSSGKLIESEISLWTYNLLRNEQYSNNLYKYTLSAGKYYFKISSGSKGKYELEIFKAKNLNSSKTKVSKIPSQVYTGKKITPKFTVKYGSKKLKEKKDYTVKFKENLHIGISTVYIKGKGNYKGTVTTDFAIIPKSVKIKKLINKKAGRLAVKWTKNKNAYGYYVIYATNKKFKKAKKVYTRNSYIILKNLKKNKTYYVKIEAIQQHYNGMMMWSSKPSPVNSIKI